MKGKISNSHLLIQLEEEFLVDIGYSKSILFYRSFNNEMIINGIKVPYIGIGQDVDKINEFTKSEPYGLIACDIAIKAPLFAF